MDILNSWPVALLCLIFVIPVFYVGFYLLGNSFGGYVLIILVIGIIGMIGKNREDNKQKEDKR